MTRKRLISLALAVVMLLSTAVIPVAAESETDTEPDSSSEVTWEDVLAGVADPYDYYGPIDPSTVPEAVGIDVANERQHVERLYEEEGTSLYNAKFKNADGTITEYLFDYPIKYIDENGDIKDITLEIESDAIEEGVYVTAANSIETTMSRSIFDGIGLNYSDLSVTLIPILETTASSASMSSRAASAQAETSITSTAELIDDRTVSYYYDDKTTIEYSLTYAGFKEDIVVSEYTGQTEYEFTLLTEGLTLTEIDGSYYLTDDYNIKATLGDIIIFTADEKNNTMGWMTHETVVANQEYVITIHVDADYLRDENTAYPIRIDPTIEVNADNGSGSGAIQDVTINSESESSGSSGSLYVGKREGYGISRVLMRFIGLDLSEVSSADKILSATVEIRDILCESETMAVYCNIFTGNTWTESTADWSSVSPNSMGSSLGYQPVSYSIGANLSSPHRYSFNITAAVKYWFLNPTEQSKGIIFHSSSVETGSTYINKTFASYNRTSNKPSLTVEYEDPDGLGIADGTYYLNNKFFGKYIRNSPTEGAITKSGLLSTWGTSIQWQINAVDGGYIIRPSTDSSLYLAGSSDLTSTDVSLETISGTTIPNRCIWEITAADGGGCIFKNKYSNRYLHAGGGYLYALVELGEEGSEDYLKKVWRVASTSYYGNSSSNTKRELTSGFSISNLTIDIAQSKAPTINKSPSNALWASASDFEYTLTNTSLATVNQATGKFTGASDGTTVVNVTHKVTGRTTSFTVKVNKNAIIIIPGIMGSQLKATSTYGVINAGETVWLPIDRENLEQNAKVIEKINAMKFDDTGGAVCSNIDVYWNGNAYDPTTNFGALDTYSRLNTTLYNEFCDRYEVVFFQYDWRYSNAVSANKLNTFINNKEYDNVVLVAHSMGGLVAANYLKLGTDQQDKVRTLITLGTPFFGSIDMVEYFQLCRYANDLLDVISLYVAVSDSAADDLVGVLAEYANSATDILHNMPAVYELFPNKQYFDVTERYYLKNIEFLGMSNENVSSYAETKAVLLDKLYGYNSSLMTNADTVNNGLFSNGEYITNTVNSYYIVGTNISTTQYITFDSSAIYTFHSKITSNCGDGTVATWSADLGGLYPTRTYYVNNTPHTGVAEYDKETKEATIISEGLVASEAVEEKIINIINGSPNKSVDGITQTPPSYTSEASVSTTYYTKT